MLTNEFILNRFGLTYVKRPPVEIPNFGRDNLAELFEEIGFDRGAEIGVKDGLYSEILCKANPRLKMYGVDPFITYDEYSDFRVKSTVNKYHQDALNRLAPFKDRYTMIEKFSVEAAMQVPDNSLDFVYIDGNHEFSYVTSDIHVWRKKVKKGGIISGHDYFKHAKSGTKCHVYQVVNAYCDAYFIKPWFVLGRNAIIDGEVRDSARSWMFINQ